MFNMKMTKPTKSIILAFTLNDSAVADYYLSLAHEMEKRGYQVVIITPGKRTNKISITTNPAVYTWPSKRPTTLKDALFLRKLIQQYKPIIVLSTFVATNICLLVSWLMGVPCRFVTYHSSVNHNLKGKELFIQKYKNFRRSFIYLLSSKVLPVSEAMACELNSIYKVPNHKISVFYNALLDPGLYDRKGFKNKNFVCVAVLTYGKGHDVLIRALHIVEKSHHDVKLFLVGDGDYKAHITELISNLGLGQNIELVGQIKHQEAISLMAEAYAVILATRFEAFGYVIIEAMSVGTPVIASKVGGIPELIRDGVDGYLVPVENYQLLAKSILKLIEEPSLRNQMGANAREHYVESFELNKAIKKQADWLENQINHLYS